MCWHLCLPYRGAHDAIRCLALFDRADKGCELGGRNRPDACETTVDAGIRKRRASSTVLFAPSTLAFRLS